MTSKMLRLFVASVLLTPVLALAAVPATVAFSARIADSGKPVTGTQSFTFVLWNDPTAGTAVWTEGPRNIPVNDGVVATALGDTTTTPPGTALPTFTGAPLWLEVTMGTTTFSPRIAIQSVPYALVAGGLASYPVTRFVTLPGGACAYAPSVTTAALLRQPHYCDLSDGTTNYSAYLAAEIPAGAVIQGLQIFAYASGTITCNLYEGLSNFGTLIASATKTGIGWGYGAEATASYSIDNTQGHAVACSATGVASDQALGTVLIRYTLAGP